MSQRKIDIVNQHTKHHSSLLYKLYVDHRGRDLSEYPQATQMVLGQPLPDFQRKLCWSEEQNIRLIESIWYGYSIGEYAVATFESSAANGELSKYSDVLIDGQQRLNAIERYWNGEFKVLGYYWNELYPNEHRQFTSTKFSHIEIMTTDEQLLKDAYNRLNFGGVAHNEDERA